MQYKFLITNSVFKNYNKFYSTLKTPNILILKDKIYQLE